MEAAVTLFIAKLLTGSSRSARAERHLPDVVIVPQASRLFRVRPVFRRTERLLSAFVTSPLPKVLASESAYGLDEHFEETGFIKILSSAVWNKDTRREQVLLPNMFMVRNHPYGHDIAFIPRGFEPRSGPLQDGGAALQQEPPNADLISLMLQRRQLLRGPHEAVGGRPSSRQSTGPGWWRGPSTSCRARDT